MLDPDDEVVTPREPIAARAVELAHAKADRIRCISTSLVMIAIVLIVASIAMALWLLVG